MQMKSSWIGLLGALTLVAGCAAPLPVEGAICPCPDGYTCGKSGRCERPPPAPDNDPPEPPPDREATVCVQPGPTPVRPLGAVHYRNSVQDLLGVTVDTSALGPDDDLPSDLQPPSNPFHSELAQKYLKLADEAAAAAMARLPQVLPCAPDPPGEVACARKFAGAFGHRAFRRPLQESEIAVLLVAFEEGRRLYGGDLGYRRLIQQILAAEDFYLRKDVGGPTGPRPGLLSLTQWEIATRLSYFLWGAPPDDELREKAAALNLGTKAAVQAQAERLLASPRAEAMIADFYRRWLHLDRVRSKEADSPAFSPELRASLVTSAQETLALSQWRRGLDQRALFGGPLVGNRAMSDFYALSMPAGTGFEALEPLGTQKRFGVLTLPALMSTLAQNRDSSLVQRGVFVLRRFMCLSIPAPPDTIPALAEPRPNATTRERFAVHSANPVCWGCHAHMDPIGFALENYDGYGRWREYDEQGRLIDVSSGQVGDLLGQPFDGPQGLAALLANSRDVAECTASNWFSYAMGRPVLPTDGCTVKELFDAYDGSGRKLSPLLIAIVRSDAFLTRKAP